MEETYRCELLQRQKKHHCRHHLFSTRLKRALELVQLAIVLERDTNLEPVLRIVVLCGWIQWYNRSGVRMGVNKVIDNTLCERLLQ